MEKPILFSTEMVRAILQGQKTQTRRVVANKFNPANWDFDPKDKNYGPFMEDKYGEWYRVQDLCPYGQPGDILWVRETWAYEPSTYCFETQVSIPVVYRADYQKPDLDLVKWRPSIHMPREAARIFLGVKNVKIERLQDITEEDARAEGVLAKSIHGYLLDHSNEWCRYTMKAAKSQGREGSTAADDIGGFAYIWDSIYAKREYGWDKNPWVWVIEFEIIHSKDNMQQNRG